MLVIFARQANELSPVAGDELLVRSNHRLACSQRLPDPTAGWLQAADELHNDVDVRGKDVANLIRPSNSAGQPIHSLALDVAIADMRKLYSRRRILGENSRHGTADCTEPDNGDSQRAFATGVFLRHN